MEFLRSFNSSQAGQGCQAANLRDIEVSNQHTLALGDNLSSPTFNPACYILLSAAIDQQLERDIGRDRWSSGNAAGGHKPGAESRQRQRCEIRILRGKPR